MLMRIRRCEKMVATSLFLAACVGDEPETTRILRPVLTQEVGYAGGATVRTFSGTAQTGTIINLSFRTGGIITQFDIALGQRVLRGQPLAQLDDVQARLAYEQSVSSLNSAASQLNTTRLNLDRIRSLYEKGSSSLSDYENARNSFQTAEASYESAERSVEIQQDQLSYSYLSAPESGTIAAIMAEVNENVSAGQSVAVLNAGSDMEIALGLPEGIINRVDAGMDVEINFTALPGSMHRGRVTEVSPSIDANTATYPVRISVIDPSDGIRGGMAANVTFEFGDQQGAVNTVVVPAQAVGEDSQGRFVFLIEPTGETTGSAKKQHVVVGSLTSEGFEIREGLRVGQLIATAGLQTLLDGQEVRLQ